jgi:hypothetical protein
VERRTALVGGQLDLIAVAEFAPVAAQMASQEGCGVFGGLGQGCYGAAGDPDSSQRKSSAFKVATQLQNEAAVVDELTVRACRAECGGDPASSKAAGGLYCEISSACRTAGLHCRHRSRSFPG